MNGMILMSNDDSVGCRYRMFPVGGFLALFLGLLAAPAAQVPGTLGSVDFRYSLPWWQTAICLPDDPDKMLVGREGQLLLDFGGGGVRNFGISFQPDLEAETRWVRQQTVSARAPIVQTYSEADGIEVTQEAFVVPPDANILAGEGDAKALAAYGGRRLPERRAVMLMTLKNTTPAAVAAQPILRLRTVTSLTNPGAKGAAVGEGTRVLASEPVAYWSGTQQTGFVAHLPAVKLRPGGSHQVAFTVERHAAKPGVALTVPQAGKLRDRARQWWEQADLPFATIQVPDAGVQAVLESAVRNIWQAREIKEGKPAFHVGPTVYRGLWVVDGSFLLESAAILGRARDARAGIEYLLSFQKPDGSFELLSHYWKENGIVLWAATRHARLMQDRTWLESVWPKLEHTAMFIRELRRRSLEDDFPLDHGLNPPGEIDGGLSGAGFKRPEFSNVYWNLTGLKAFIEAARWLGKVDEAASWQREYDDFYATFRQAADRDLCQDGHGHTYLPILMGNAGNQLPQRAQWAFCHAVYPGRIFPAGDPLVAGNLAMLEATEQEGMVFGTGWMADGIWTYFASFYAHAWLWQGRGAKAAEVLYAFANHASPTRVWREEQRPVGKGIAEVGDMPHNWASAEFIRLTAHLIELDRGDELHLLEGFPADWARPGMTTRLNGVLTPFGPLRLEVRVAQNGRTARVRLGRLTASAPARIVLHLDGLTGVAGTLELPVDKDVDRTVER